jgi:hypothetical protein
VVQDAYIVVDVKSGDITFARLNIENKASGFKAEGESDKFEMKAPGMSFQELLEEKGRVSDLDMIDAAMDAENVPQFYEAIGADAYESDF